MLDTLHFEDYAQYLNTSFKAEINPSSIIEMELIGAEDRSSSRHEHFVLTFHAPCTAPATQQMFMIHHELLGDGLIFLVPIAKDANGVTYEAVFNRLKSAEL